MVINCVKLKIIPNDQHNGFLFIPLTLVDETLKMPPEVLCKAGVTISNRSARDYCTHCDEIADKKCSRCKKVHYCSAHCQNVDWKKHKLVCQKI
jgi:hypothetical protein